MNYKTVLFRWDSAHFDFFVLMAMDISTLTHLLTYLLTAKLQDSIRTKTADSQVPIELPLMVSWMTAAHSLVFSIDDGNIPGEEFTSNNHGV